MMNKLGIAKAGYIAISFVFYLAAVLCLFSARLPPAMLSIFSGVCLLVYGTIKLIGYFSEDLYCLVFRYDLALGLLLLVIGALVLVRYRQTEAWLSPGIGWIALLDSVMKVQMAQEAEKFGLKQWKGMLTAAILTGVLSVLHILWSTAGTGDTNILTALILLSLGIMNHSIVQSAISGPYISSRQKKKRGASDEKGRKDALQ